MKPWLSLAWATLAGAVLIAAPSAFADGHPRPSPDVAAPPVHARPIPAPAAPSATPAPTHAAAPAVGRSGQIALMNGGIALNVPAGYKFYSAEAALSFLQRNHATAPSGTVLGVIAPASAQIESPDTWATVLSYDAINYVSSDTAGGLAAPDLEDRVHAARDGQGRPFEGFALQPGFDAIGHSLVWAERSAAPGSGGRDFRHEQRLLGRSGVAGLTSLGSADQMGAIVAAAPSLFSMVSFPAGHAYADFSPASDATSAYSIPGLVTGIPESNPNLVAGAASAGGVQRAASGLGEGGLHGLFPWIALGVAALAGVGYMISRRRQSEDANLSPDD